MASPLQIVNIHISEGDHTFYDVWSAVENAITDAEVEEVGGAAPPRLNRKRIIEKLSSDYVKAKEKELDDLIRAAGAPPRVLSKEEAASASKETKDAVAAEWVLWAKKAYAHRKKQKLKQQSSK